MDLWLTLAAIAGLVTGVRWLRVAQREHYLPWAAGRFAWRWWTSSAANCAVGVLAVAGLIGVWWNPPLGWGGLAAAVGPLGLSWRGTTSRLAWTPRLTRLALVTAMFSSIVVAASLVTQRPGIALGTLVSLPILVDAALAATAPLERMLGKKWVSMAATKLNASGARVVAITGSYGKTTTKRYVALLLSGRMQVVTSPASFNNRMGLARAINEHLVPGTEVFVAEMGTYRRGEIAELCEFVPPEVAVITAIGPVHLERFQTEEAIVEAKREIVAKADVAVICIDHPLLARVADEEATQRKVVRTSALDASADVAVVDGVVTIGGEVVGAVGPDLFPSNLACAVAVANYLGLPTGAISRRLATLANPNHRREVTRSDRGFVIIDDTYNSNPTGARSAIDALASVGEQRRVVVTPGMVELGEVQFEENRKLGADIALKATDLVVVGSTNRRALLEGSKDGPTTVTVVRSRSEAVEWVRTRLGSGDAVLYENDLPDHYP